MIKEEWLRRCAQRYIEMAHLREDEARDLAKACWDQRTPDDSPEDAADEDMSYWDDES